MEDKTGLYLLIRLNPCRVGVLFEMIKINKNKKLLFWYKMVFFIRTSKFQLSAHLFFDFQPHEVSKELKRKQRLYKNFQRQYETKIELIAVAYYLHPWQQQGFWGLSTNYGKFNRGANNF